MPELFCLIVAAGRGERFGTKIPKQFMPLRGKPVLQYAIEAFLHFMPPENICIVHQPDHQEWVQDCIGPLPFMLQEGENERKKSVYNGLIKFSNAKHNDLILIHDAARPFPSYKLIKSVIDALSVHPAVCPVLAATDTIHMTNEDHALASLTDRTMLRLAQTPQGFHYGVIRTAHEILTDTENITDDASMVYKLGMPVKFVNGDRLNLKITHKEDLDVLKTLKFGYSEYEYRTGTGFDVHSYRTASAPQNAYVTLGGVRIPHTHAVNAHSDGDVILHALTDALLGTIGAGDIGLHFPPSDPKWKDAASETFVRHALTLVKEQGGTIVNADITLLCEKPHISIYRKEIESKIQEILKLTSGRVNLKATTTEKLGFIGREEGLAAQVAVSVRFPAED